MLRALVLLACLWGPLAGVAQVQTWDARGGEGQSAAGASAEGAEGGGELSETGETVLEASDGGDEEVVDELAAAREKQAKTSVGAVGQQIDQDLLALQGAMSKGASALDILRDKKMRQSFINAFQNNPMAQLPREAVRPMLAEQLKKTPWGKVADRFPKFLDFMVDFMRDPRAVPQLVKMLDRTVAMRNCGIASIVLWILLLVVRKKVQGRRASFFRKLGYQLVFSLAFFAGSLAIFWATFEQELGPTVAIARAAFLS